MSHVANKVGKVYGCLIVIKRVDDFVSESGRKRVMYECHCSVCGGTHFRMSHNLHDNSICPDEPCRKIHGKSNTKLYDVWNTIKLRCYKPSQNMYSNYGGRGIEVCDEWLNDFINFYNWAIENGYQDGLQIDRINVDGNYEPNNCRWVTRTTNANNKRNNIKYTHDGVTLTMKQWCQKLGLNYKTVMTRYYRGHTIGECLGFEKFIDKRSVK
jgi:hypothetical protein